MYLPSRKASKMLGLHPRTLRRYAELGKIKYYKNVGGQNQYDVEDFLRGKIPAKTVCYCRVSSSKQRDDLRRQEQFMRERYPDAEIISDVGSGLNFKRKGLQTLLERLLQGDKLEVIVAHRDRLTRFGVPLFEYLLEKTGGKLLVLNKAEQSPEQELTADLLSILHVFSARMHGLRKYSNKIKEDKDIPYCSPKADS